MDAKGMLNLVQRFQDNQEFITNEESTKAALVVPFIRLLGYDPASPREVRLEYAAPFVQGDGKRLPDRMDYAIFDKSGHKPLMVIEAKPLNFNLDSRSPQLARYVAQMPDLHFGILTNGCQFLFFGDLEQSNVMDKDPFFQFSLEDDKADWGKVASFLSKFSRDSFNADTLIGDAENSRYRQAMIDKLTITLKAPDRDDDFLRWLTADIYKGKRTASVMERMGELAREAVEPTLFRFMTDNFVDRLRERMQSVNALVQGDPSGAVSGLNEIPTGVAPENDPPPRATSERKRGVETTEDEMAVYESVRSICSEAGIEPERILYKDTVNYLNISVDKKRNWFLRYLDSAKRRNIATPLPVEELKTLAPGFDVEEAPGTFGVSRVYIEGPSDVMKLSAAVLASVRMNLS